MDHPVTVAIVEDEPCVLERFCRVITANPRLKLVFACSTATEMICWLPSEPADVLLVDIGLPDCPGLDVIRACRRLQPACQIMAITVFGDPQHMVEAFEAGARGYLLKDGTDEELGTHVLELQAGGSPMSPLIARQLLNRWQERQPDQPMKPKGASWRGDGLSKRELDVLQLVSRGCTYQETAEHLGIKVFTVQAHVRNIYAKLEVHNKAEAIFEARQLGLLG